MAGRDVVLPPNFRLKNGPRYNRCKPGGKASGKVGSKGGGKSGDKTGGKAGGKGGWKGGEEGGEEGGALPNLVCLGSEIRGSASSCGLRDPWDTVKWWVAMPIRSIVGE